MQTTLFLPALRLIATACVLTVVPFSSASCPADRCGCGAAPQALVRDFGAVAADGMDDTQAIQRALDSGLPVIRLSPGTYRTRETLVVPDGVTVCGYGATIRNKTNGVLLELGAHVSVCGLELEGDSAGSSSDPSVGIIRAMGEGVRAGAVCEASPSPPVFKRNIRLFDLTIHGAARDGIHLEYVSGFRVESVEIYDYGYAGIGVISGERGVIDRTRVHGVPRGYDGNAYGISLSRLGCDPRVDTPDSRDIVVANSEVADVEFWHGMDTHGGQNITFLNPVVRRCRRGIFLTGIGLLEQPSELKSSATRCSVINAEIDEGGLGAYGEAISIVGWPGKPARNNLIRGGEIRGYDYREDVEGILLQDTENTVLDGVSVFASPHGTPLLVQCREMGSASVECNHGLVQNIIVE